MKKLKAFLIASALFLAFAAGLHAYCISQGMKTSDPEFGTWYNQYKDISYSALDQNMSKNDMLVFGSSEFRHGRKTSFHPANFFRGTNVHLMTIGGPFNQTLFHTVALGALEPQIKNRRVVLMVSPSWFRPAKGVSSKGYALRFSETEYVAFLKNKDVPKDVKIYAAKRSVKLLKDSPELLSHVRLYNRVLLHMEKPHLTDALAYKAVTSYQNDKDMITTSAAMKLLRSQDPAMSFSKTPIHNGDFDWNIWVDRARKIADHKSHNQFYMSDHSWKRKFRFIYPRAEGVHKKDSLLKSKEYGDLEAFLELCQASHIRPLLIIQPMNGYWYDYTGINAHERAAFAKKIKTIASMYGAEVDDLTKYDYTPGITRDAVHPWGEGWIKINEGLYNFYTENQNKPDITDAAGGESSSTAGTTR
ncbi:MAG: D-alanyl-lipoteichoic acid biosynthesis protein DltD [Eubacterium sp.]|jgi:D-alanine transfer protein|nr:D-alanyl-lipoteichoic acid biosynthesis protein DltD [Eubacterium sp.]MCH4046595.1 D-alanyl-lipoteichoic acid biosynthesis protein DltD [Eubacterium sp.]MCH4079691.1 D-alanyl-lipoteichoic acid biosynthesis protein DltD [Eubacterium sp.]MCH4110251.1 D-alanyl-lipoteichoic acid biosynthesis protein DltD [Eubacterium sp.]MCI1307853.1 D-alanyl-lipoteichoic acid biosynthesis protein DltD [Eubacterium sp.]